MGTSAWLLKARQKFLAILQVSARSIQTIVKRSGSAVDFEDRQSTFEGHSLIPSFQGPIVKTNTSLPTSQAPARHSPISGYAPVNGLKIYYEVHGGGEPGFPPPCVTLRDGAGVWIHLGGSGAAQAWGYCPHGA